MFGTILLLSLQTAQLLPLLVSLFIISSSSPHLTYLSLLLFIAHDSELHFIDFTADMVEKRESKSKSDKVVYPGNPVLNGHFINNDTYIGCGFDNAPLIFKRHADGWKFEGSLDPGFSK